MVDEEKGELHIIWDVDDIQYYASSCLEPGECAQLSREEALEVLHRLDRGHDCNRGIDWKTVEQAIRDHLSDTHEALRRAVND